MVEAQELADSSDQPVSDQTPPATSSPGTPASSRWRTALLPSFADCLFIALIVWLFIVGAGGWGVLLGDGDTGWHIRIGESILDTGVIPRTDPFSFSKPGAPWYAWEWLADVIFAFMFRQLGLKGVTLLAGVLIALFGMLLIRYMSWRGANPLLALAVGMLAVGAASVHYLARPHVFTLVLLVTALWLLDRDRRSPTAAVWLLAPLTALWANLHAGFVVLFPCLGILIAGTALETLLNNSAGRRDWGPTRRYVMVAAACAAASAVNPFGIELHRHILTYLSADWIKDAVEEFKSPSFRTESMFHFEILLFTGLMTAAAQLARKRVVHAGLILLWAHLSLISTRHITIFAIVAAPAIASEATLLWKRLAAGCKRRSVVRILDQVFLDLAPGFRRNSVWPVLFVVLLVVVDAPLGWPRDFPEDRFPIAMVNRHADRIANARVFANDEWADYLIYRFYPVQRVFFDGRSDFYGHELLKQFVSAYQGGRDWEQILDRHGSNLVLTPPDCALSSLLKQSVRWRLVEEDGAAVLFVRRPQGTLPDREGEL